MDREFEFRPISLFESFTMLDDAVGVVRPCRSATLMTTFPDGYNPSWSSRVQLEARHLGC